MKRAVAIVGLAVGLAATPAAAKPLGGVVDVAAGGAIGCALRRTGDVVCWGGDDVAPPADYAKQGAIRLGPKPVRLPGLDGVARFSLGDGNLCAVLGSGQVRCFGIGWPYGLSPLRDIPAIADATGVSVGARHTCAVRRDGRVTCWGDNEAGALGAGDVARHAGAVDVPGISDAVEVAAGDGHTCARRRGGEVLCWGRKLGLRNPRGEPLVPQPVPGLADAVGIACGSGQGCAARKTGEVVCWGRGAFGVADREQTGKPTAIPGVSGAVEVSVAAVSIFNVARTCARLANGEVKCWGAGALGDGKVSSAETTPAATAAGVRDAIHVATSREATCVATRAGTALCWGPNGRGEVGRALQVVATPTRVSAFANAAHVFAGSDRTCALLRSGALVCGGPRGRTTLPAAALGPARQIAVGQEHTCALRGRDAAKPGSVVCWGANRMGQLGDGTVVDHDAPAATMPPLDDVTALRGSAWRTCALRASGRVSCWGDASYTHRAPELTGGVGDAVDVAVGDKLFCALRRGGEVGCFGGIFGDHAYGPELALARRETPPSTVAGLSRARTVAAAEGFVCAARADGKLACSGGTHFLDARIGRIRESNAPPTRELAAGGPVAALTAGTSHACLLRPSGTVACWGAGVFGQLGGGASTEKPAETLVPVAGLDGVEELASGDLHTCARRRDGEVFCWGYDIDGRVSGEVRGLRPGPVEE